MSVPGRRLLVMACVLGVLAGCGQRGPLYVPDKNARVVTRAASQPAAASSAAEASAPAPAPR